MNAGIQHLKLPNKDKVQVILTAACFFASCLATWRNQTVVWGAFREFSRDSLGVLIACILMTHYKWQDFVKYKIPYIIYGIIAIICSVAVVPTALKTRYDFLYWDTIIIAIGIILMGICIIHTAISFFVEKYRPRLYLPLFFLWIAMMLWMIFSKSDYIWPECYFVLYLCLYLTKQTSRQRINTTKGMLDGIIAGYIAMQGFALLFRPYFSLRYYGNFCNPNHNCMFLCMCLAAMLGRLLFCAKEGESKLTKVFLFLLTASCYSFIFMTMCRSGFFAVFVITIFFLIAYCRIKGKKVFLRTGLLLTALFVICLPITHSAARYLPNLSNHIVFYFYDPYTIQLVNTWDDRTAPEHTTSFAQMMEASFGRLAVTPESQSAASEVQSTDTDNAEPPEIQPQETNPDKIPALPDESNPLLVRYTIYRWYIKHLSLRGMPYSEQGFQLTPTHWVQDTHNIYLDYGINFGYPAMIMFTVFVLWGGIRLFRTGYQSKDAVKLACLLIFLLPPVFGMFEFAWGAGLISTVAFYFCFKEVFDEGNN